MSRRRLYRVLVSTPDGLFEIKEQSTTTDKGRERMAALCDVVRQAMLDSLNSESDPERAS